MTLRTGLLKRIDKIRQIPQRLDLRQNRVFVVIRQSGGAVVGQGTAVDLVTELFISGSYRIKAQQVSMKDIVASGGYLTDQDVKVGPFTPEYLSGGVPRDVFDPPVANSPREILFLVTGHGMPANGRYYKRQYDESLMNFHNTLYLRATGELP